MGEWFHNWFNEDYLKLYSGRDENEAKKQIAFLLNNLEIPRHARILDLGCGAGRHSKILSKMGFDVVGLDASDTLIEKARKNSSAQFVVGDMRDLKNLGAFDLIANFFTSFGYFKNDEENRKVLVEAASALNPKGYFFLDFLDPEQVERDLVPEEETIVNGEKVRIRRKIENGRIVKSILFPGRSYEESVRLYSKHRIEQMLEEAGFKMIGFWKGYPGEKKRRQLFLSVLSRSG